jgi:hypothetical protein
MNGGARSLIPKAQESQRDSKITIESNWTASTNMCLSGNRYMATADAPEVPTSFVFESRRPKPQSRRFAS